jgi:phosphomannomutase
MTLFLFDVDGTLVESGQIIQQPMIECLKQLAFRGELGIVGGGTYEKIKSQLGEVLSLFKYVFAESGSSFYQNNQLIHQNYIKQHQSYSSINNLKKIALKFLSTVDYDLVGHLLDQRDGLLYISLIGMQANQLERNNFIQLDHLHHYRKRLLDLLIKENQDEEVEITLGGSVGIGINLKTWNKAQVLAYLPKDKIYYFGDKYLPDGNDYPLMMSTSVIGQPVDNLKMTMDKIRNLVQSSECSQLI